MNKHTIGGRLEYNHEDDRADVRVEIRIDGAGGYADRVIVWSVDGDPLMPYRFEGRFPVLYPDLPKGEGVELQQSDDIRTALREAGWEIL